MGILNKQMETQAEICIPETHNGHKFTHPKEAAQMFCSPEAEGEREELRPYLTADQLMASNAAPVMQFLSIRNLKEQLHPR